MNLRIANTLLSAIPSGDKSKWIRKEMGKRLAQGDLPEISNHIGTRGSVYLDKWISADLEKMAAKSGRTPNEIFGSCLSEVLGVLAPVIVDVKNPEPTPKKETVKVSAIPRGKPKAFPRIGKKMQLWMDGLEERLLVIRADVAVGRWGVFCITGGSPAVKPNEPMDAAGIRDFDDEIRQGLVVQELIPWEYNEDEAHAWLKARHAEGKPLSWYYISGDSESLNDAQEARRRGELQADKRFPDMFEALAKVEREETLERAAFGRKRYYLDWAVRDRDRLIQIAARDGVEVQVPKNLARLAERASSPLLLGVQRTLEIGMARLR